MPCSVSCQMLGRGRPFAISRKPIVPRRARRFLGSVGEPGFTQSTPSTHSIHSEWVSPKIITSRSVRPQ